MEVVWRTTSSEGVDLDLDGLGQLILPGGGDNAWPEAIMDAPSFPPIFLSDATTATATTNNCLGQPSVAMASEGDPDQLVSGDNASAAMASSSFSFFASTSAFLLDATTNGGAPASANTSSIQPSISTMSWEGIEIDLDGLGQGLLPCNNAWLGATIDAPSSPSFFASPSIFPSYATTITTPTNNTCLGQPSITAMESEGAMFDLDLDHLLSGDSPRLQVATIASSSPSFFDSPSTFPLFDATTSWETPASTNTYLIQPNMSTTSSHGPAVLLERLFSGDNTWSEVAAIASSSTSFFGYPSSFRSDATTNGCTPASTNTCLIQPSIPSSHGAAVDSDHLREQPLSLSLSGHKPWPELTFDASSLPSLFAPSSIKKRFNQALSYISESLFQTHRCNDVLLQVWVPAKLGDGDGRFVLTTWRQSYWFCTISGRVKWLRNSSQHQLITNVVSESTPVGLPGRVFMSKVYSFGEPAVSEQSGYETLGLPVFEKGNNSCLGVIELIMPTRELNFTSEVNAICRALQAVNLTTTNVPIIPRSKFNNASYEDALPEVLEVSRAACSIHELPLAQTWATCGLQGKRCRRHSDENCRYCISTIDRACYVNDAEVLDFHYASSELQLLLGQGAAGKAFTTNQLCFLPNIASSSEHEYPFHHQAKIFRLKGAAAIQLRYTPTRMGDLVLEFFLPTNCEVENEQKEVLNSLWGTVQRLCRTLRMVIDKEMEDDAMREFQKNKMTNKRKRMP